MAMGGTGFTVMAERELSVLELVMELMRLPASFLVMVAGGRGRRWRRWQDPRP